MGGFAWKPDGQRILKATLARWRFMAQDGEMTRSDPTSASTPGTVVRNPCLE